MLATDKQLSAEQSRQVAATIREELARRRISRQHLAEQAKISISTLEKALGGRRPFTLATTVRLEEALGVSLRKGTAPPLAAPVNGDVAPDSLGAYSRRAVAWIEGTYLTLRPSFGDKDAIYAYRTEIVWDAKASCLLFRESERLDAAFTQFGEVAVPNQSGPRLSRHQPARPVPADHGVAADHHRRDVRHPHDAARRPRLAADADRGADRVRAACDDRGADLRPHRAERRQSRDLQEASAAHHRRAVRDVRVGLIPEPGAPAVVLQEIWAMPGKRVQIDDETWTALDMLAKDRMQTFQELAEEAFADVLKKHGRPVSLREALQKSAGRSATVHRLPGKKR